ncbi:MAG: S41 family peptidase [Blastocatellia bacterium]|nr:S41 family peptidase [Blastocatellia bacterium]
MRTSNNLRFLAVLTITGLLVSTSAYTYQTPAFSREPWIEDYQALKRYLQEGYANLEWMQQHRKIDLAALDAKTRQSLSEAKTDEEAKRALKQFLETFRDGHLGLREASGPDTTESNDPLVFNSDTPGREVCRSLGYRFRLRNYSIPIDKDSGFRTVSTGRDAFTTGILSLDNGKKYGALRIPLFSPTGYWLNCEEGWEEYRKRLTGACGPECQWQFRLFTADRLSAMLAEQVKALQSMKVDGLIVDIGGNGGGTEWVDPIARILSEKRLRAPRVGRIRHPHSVRAIERNIALVEKDLARKDLTPRQTDILTEAKKKLHRLASEVGSPCDKSKIWTLAARTTGCSMMNSTPIFSTGVFDYARPGEFEGLLSKFVLFGSSQYAYEEGAFKGPLIIIVDRSTASASEYFAAMFQDDEAAIIAGEPTRGVGCGYTNGGLSLTLPNSRMRVAMPDCARYRRDDTNEIEGVHPDLLIWDEKDDKPARAAKFLKAIRGLK